MTRTTYRVKPWDDPWVILIVAGLIGGAAAAYWALQRGPRRNYAIAVLAFVVGFWIAGGLAAGLTGTS